MKVWVLGSGSAGNAALIECGESRVLVDAGFSPRELASRLRSVDVDPASIEACVVTHEHTDHIKGAAASARKWGWSVYASGGTCRAWPELADVACITIEPGVPSVLSRVLLTTYVTPHDAEGPVGVRIACARTGAVAVICTDIGHASDDVRALCASADVLVVESNHDDGMLRAGPYPYFLQQRIASRLGHLSNRACADLARSSVHRDLAHVVLAHLSEKCNDHALAYAATADALRRTRFRGTLSVAMQHGVVGPFVPRAGRSEVESQYLLAL